jgi:hypothetical protein
LGSGRCGVRGKHGQRRCDGKRGEDSRDQFVAYSSAAAVASFWNRDEHLGFLGFVA